MNVAWYLSRSAGMVAYLILFLTVVLGISIRTKGLDRYLARWKVTDLHIFLSILALGFVAIHAGVLLWDSFVGYSLVDILVPFATGYRTFWTGIGIVMLYLLIVVAVSFPARRWIGYRTWRTLHYSTFVVYVGALGHGMFTGTDSRVAWAQALYLGTATVVLALVLYRIYVWRRREHTVLRPVLEAGNVRRAPSQAMYAARDAANRLNIVENRATGIGFGALLLTAVLFLAAGFGPFRWFTHNSESQQADDLAAASSDQPASSSSGAVSPAAGFSDTFAGSATQTQSGSTVKLSLVANGNGQRAVTVDVELQLAQSGRRTTATSNSVQLKDNGGATLCTGEVQSLTQDGLEATCQGQGSFAGHQLTLEMQFDQGLGSQMTGTLDATSAS